MTMARPLESLSNRREWWDVASGEKHAESKVQCDERRATKHTFRPGVQVQGAMSWDGEGDYRYNNVASPP